MSLNEAPRSKLRGIKAEFVEADPPLLYDFGGPPCHFIGAKLQAKTDPTLLQVADASKPLWRRRAAGYSGEGE